MKTGSCPGKVSIRIADSDIDFHAETGDPLLRAALRSGIGMAYDCNSGGCGSCQIELVEGEIEDIWPEAPGIGARARKRGRLLACQCRPLSDCVVEARVEDRFRPVVLPQRRSVRLVGFRPITHDLAEFTFASEDGKADFQPGQYAMLAIPGVEGERAYSMANLANAEGQWSFVIKRMAGGAASNRLFDEREALEGLELDGPYGTAYLREETPRDIILVAGGSGLSPILSIAAGIARSEKLAGKRVMVFYGGREAKDLCAARQLDRLFPDGHRFEVIEATSEGEEGAWEAGASRVQYKGFIHEVLAAYLKENALDFGGFGYYFCGPPPMTNALLRMLQLEFNVPEDQLFFDSFL